MAHHLLQTPMTDEFVKQLRVGDTVTVNGHIFGIRDANLIRIFDHKTDPPEDLIPQLRGAVTIHTAPGVKKLENGKYEKVCIGTTTSTRMDRFVEGLFDQFGVKAITGKGGMLEPGAQACVDLGGVYFSIVGGAAALETIQIEEIEDVWWEDLMPEAIWKLRVKDFGPLLVSVDSYGGNLYKDVKTQAINNLDKVYGRLGIK
ncbi:L(+)-tartrate dehydratase subunit beta [Paenibacillus allorhizoplanae]|uniref:L(+)-tartrate dehydratase subunit beta n=1 Tax=Paenibacillus allorhizoplanae TaxID=2905648 RepID=A0ABN8H204_9BACL|nr:FumA C-terminus/TtdB family hydratase beta subunit [Paenibacillus allorhizoplanae]CAH1221218.1 L(+)-tartrate dehydratase subunit beta [Paenibacillus allorhizoplanae]